MKAVINQILVRIFIEVPWFLNKRDLIWTFLLLNLIIAHPNVSFWIEIVLIVVFSAIKRYIFLLFHTMNIFWINSHVIKLSMVFSLVLWYLILWLTILLIFDLWFIYNLVINTSLSSLSFIIIFIIFLLTFLTDLEDLYGQFYNIFITKSSFE